MPQRARALRVAPIFGPRYVAKLVRSTAATACTWLLAILRKLTATWHTWAFQQSPRAKDAPLLFRQVSHRSEMFNTLPGPLELHFHCLLQRLVKGRPLLHNDIHFPGVCQ
jgi:hypothetical protein